MLPTGRIKTTPEDFVVDEIPAYEPSGEGEHLFVKFEKRGLTTDAAVRAMTRALGVEMRDVGIAGMKDKVALTTQWISLRPPAKDTTIEERARALAIHGVRVLEAKRHGNKLKTGHLRGNRFKIVVRGLAAGSREELAAAFARIGVTGVPNAFGLQRFGKDKDNAERARAWLLGKERAPKDARLRRFHFSAFQSAIFNAVLEARVADGTWNVPLAGDLLKKEDTGGLFLCTDVQADRERGERGEVCPTGPIFGDRMRKPEGDVLALEERIAAPFIDGVDFARARTLGEGTRRALRLVVRELTFGEVGERLPADGSSISQVMDKEHKGNSDEREQADSCTVCFVLPKGSYATTVLANVFDVVDASRGMGGERGETETETDPETETRTEEQ